MPHELTLLFDAVGASGYIKLMHEKLVGGEENFQFNELEEMLILNKKKQVEEKLTNCAKKIEYRSVLGLKAGIAFIDYEYRNDLAQYLREHNYDIDFVMLIALDYGTISYRTVKEDVNVRKIAEAMGGKGHDKAASSPISLKQKEEIVKILLKERGAK